MKKFALFLIFFSLFFFFGPHFSFYSFAQTPTSTPCYNGDLGNLNCDSLGTINREDLLILLGSWKPQDPAPAPPSGQHSADLNSDNKVNEIDTTVVLNNWDSPPLLTPTPIPATTPPPAIPPFTPDPSMNQTLVSNPDQAIGQCWYVNPEILNKDFVSWGYDVNFFWSHLEPQEGQYNFQWFDQSLTKFRGKNKGYLLYFQTAGIDRGVEMNPPWLIAQVRQNHPQHWITYELGGNPHGHFIAPWDPDWQAALDRLAFNLAVRYDNDPNIIGIVIPSGCRYGEMSCWPKNDTEKQLWLQAGYTDEKYTRAVEQVVTNFLKYFQKKPVYVQLGGGLNGQRGSTCYKLMSDMYAVYGLRVRYKYNGWGYGTESDIGGYYNRYGGYTNVGYEVAYQFSFLTPTIATSKIQQAVNQQHVSYACLGQDLLRLSGVFEANYRFFSTYSGTHIIMTSSSYTPNPVSASQYVSVDTSFLNRGNKPLVASKRVGPRDEPASYALTVYFINKTTGQEIRRVINPTVATNEWYGGDNTPVRTINGNPRAPATPGRYDVRIALENPYPGPHLGETWAIITDKPEDNHHRYLLGELQVNQ